MKGGIPSVARPPTGMKPKRAKGMEKVVMLGVMSRITITSEGFDGVRAGMVEVISMEVQLLL